MPNVGRVYSQLRAMVKGETPQDDTLLLRYRAVFGTQTGQEVLAHMLSEMGLFDEIPADPGAVALQNYARHLLKVMGIMQPKNTGTIVGKLMQIDYR